MADLFVFLKQQGSQTGLIVLSLQGWVYSDSIQSLLIGYHQCLVAHLDTITAALQSLYLQAYSSVTFASYHNPQKNIFNMKIGILYSLYLCRTILAGKIPKIFSFILYNLILCTAYWFIDHELAKPLSIFLPTFLGKLLPRLRSGFLPVILGNLLHRLVSIFLPTFLGKLLPTLLCGL